ncbi:bacterial alpha-L-rhamnosidase-domain-containing protein [Aspergillus parasiticus]|uniref:alpha-L-rhamnosidase n=1 Tax=Aspergillus parasiticus TaxID=5067 RepID=A0A5N6DJV5_ASPPA|nr:bacterial alpha-L-rhamnosidase-domain-containing protein [Aspergillus parasiticus]
MKLLPLLAGVLPLVSSLQVELGSLRTEGVSSPLGIHSDRPNLSWRLLSDLRNDTQTAYQVQTASSPRLLGKPDLWDSGKVASARPFTVYDGQQLMSRQEVYWRLRTWDVNDEASSWSEVGSFEMGLLHISDWKAHWITNTQFETGVNSLPIFAKEFELPCSPEKARLYITGLGVYHAEINGESISSEILGPGYSTVNRTVWYRTHDVTSMLQSGSNVIGIELGKGTYDAEKGLNNRYMKYTLTPKPLLARSQLEYTCSHSNNGTQSVLSDATWLTTVDGPQLESAWYGGEEYDAQRVIANWSSISGDRSGWQYANVSTGPVGTAGALINPVAPPIQITQKISPVSVTQVGSQWVFDFGVNYAGLYTFTMNGTGLAGTRIVFYPAENITAAGVPDQTSSSSPIFDGYTIAGLEVESFTPNFMYHGNQYIGVNTTWKPNISDMTGLVARAANEESSTLSTSNTLFNQIHEIIQRSVQSNMYSVLTDCPTREKLGWVEQDHLAFETVARSYDIQAYGHDLCRTIAESQVQWGPSGMLPSTAPEYAVFIATSSKYRKDPNWGNTLSLFALELYKYYGDKSVLSDHYTIMDQYMAYLKTRQINSTMFIINDGGLGDWEGIDSTTPTGLTSTYAYQQAAASMKEIAEVLGNPTISREWAHLEANIRSSFHQMWFNTSGGTPHYSINNQASNALALDMGAVPTQYEAEVFQSLLDALAAADWHFTVGEIALPALFRVLMARNRNDVLYKLMNQRTAASYGYQIEHGATSLWEKWDGKDSSVGSLNHFMMGFGDMWLQRLSGLAPSRGSTMWDTIDYAPIIEGDLTSATSSYRTPSGYANASWHLDGNILTYDIVVPVGSKGVVSLNATAVKEDGRDLKRGEYGVISMEHRGDDTVIEVGSGSYSFTATV